MWWRSVLVFSLAIIVNITAQDDTNATETQTQLCCPCPPGWTGSVASPVDPGSLSNPVEPVSRSAVGVDDCPCRARDADSEGAASVFFPNAVRAFGNVVRPDQKEEDTKPLLHPEVGLASSVLETLREVTDEEYRDALERDAARAAADVVPLTDLTTDGVPEEARNVVTIIVSPKDMDGSDDAIPEASHVQETRCIHPSLGNPRASATYRAPVLRKGLDDILNLPLPTGVLHRQRDSSLAASIVNENIVKPHDSLNKILSGLRLKTEPSLLALDPKTLSENINNLLTGVTLGNKVGKSSLDDCDIENTRTESPNDLMSSEAVEERDNINASVLNGSEPTRQPGSQDDLDCNSSPTNDQETVFEESAKNAGPINSLFFARNNERKPQVAFPLKNLFKLKDVELVPLDILKNKPKAKINIPTIKLNPLSKKEAKQSSKIPTQSIFFGKPSKFTTENSETGLNNLNKAKSANIQPIPKRKVVTTEILDTVPSPSDDNCVKLKPEADKSAGVNMDELEDSLLNSSTESVEPDEEKFSMGMQEGNTDVLDMNSAEHVRVKSSEILDEETITDDFQIIENTQEPGQESDSDIQIESQEDISDVPPGSIDISEINEAENGSNGISETHHTLRRLEEIRKSVVEKLEALQKSNKNALDNIKHNVEDMSAQGKERNQDTDFVENEDSNVEATFESPLSTNQVQEELRDSCATAESINFQDLQKMSDTILMASENLEQRAELTNGDSLEFKENNSASQEISEGEIDNVLGMDENKTNPNNELDQSIDDSGSLKSACLSEFKKSDQNKLENSNNHENKKSDNDLETLASDPIRDILRPTSLTSEPIMNILRPNSRSLVEHINDLGTKLRQSVVVQPSALINADDFNIFRTPSLNIPDVSSLNANLPTLEEIRTRVSEILGGLARSASDDDESSEIDCDDFASDVKPVLSTGASSPDPVTILPPLKPLEDINLDIIQLKPLPSLLGSSPITPSLPGLNLNRYKAKLAIPKSLELKPLNLASTLGSDGGLVGTTLTIGPEKKEKTSKSKFKPNKNSDFVKLSRVVSNNNPTLADITSTMHKNAMNLLNIPNNSKRPNLQASNIMDNLVETIKSHTEETVRSIHETLNPSTLADVHNNVLKSANNLLASGRNSLQKTSTPIESAVDNLRSQTQNTFQQLHNTLHSPRVADLSSVIQKNKHSILKSPKNSIDAVVDNLRAQSENNFRNIQQTLDTAPLADSGDSIHKTAQNILKSAAATSPTRNILGSSMQIHPPIDEVAGSLRLHTQNALRNIQETLNAPALSDISTTIQQSAQHVLKSPLTNNRPEILKSVLQPSTSIDTVVDNLRSQTQNTMRTIQNSINTPTLADISEKVQKHAQNLLDHSPVAFNGHEAFKQVLQASPPINLVPHAEKVAKDLQKTLKATLKNSPIKNLPPLPHPNEVLQIISDHHEDVNDKLYALHTDLTDRLESIHNEVTDPERLRSILSPPGNINFELFAIPLPVNSRSASSVLNRARPAAQAKQLPAKITQKKPKKSSTASRPRTEAVRPNSIQTSLMKENSPPKSFRIPSAASSQVSTRVDRPTLSLVPKKPLGLGEIKKSVLPKFKPLAKNKVPVTFGSTTQRPDVVKSRLLSTTAKPTKVTSNKRFKPKGPIRQPTPWNGWSETGSGSNRLGDPLTAPSQIKPNARTALKSKTAKPISNPAKTGMSSRLVHVAPKYKSQSVSSKPQSKLSPPTQGRASLPRQPLAPNKPKSPLLTKLTDAIKSKQSQALSQSPLPTAREMSSAASDRFEKVVAMEEPLKENVPYKCKMMCVKVDVNDE